MRNAACWFFVVVAVLIQHADHVVDNIGDVVNENPGEEGGGEEAMKAHAPGAGLALDQKMFSSDAAGAGDRRARRRGAMIFLPEWSGYLDRHRIQQL